MARIERDNCGELEAAQKRIAHRVEIPCAREDKSAAHILQRETPLSSQVERVLELDYIGANRIDIVVDRFSICVMGKQREMVRHASENRDCHPVVVAVAARFKIDNFSLARIDSACDRACDRIARLRPYYRIDIASEKDLDAAHVLIAERDYSRIDRAIRYAEVGMLRIAVAKIGRERGSARKLRDHRHTRREICAFREVVPGKSE